MEYQQRFVADVGFYKYQLKLLLYRVINSFQLFPMNKSIEKRSHIELP